MADAGINAIRVYVTPPRWLLDLAHKWDLLVMVGFAWDANTAFLENPGQAEEIERRVQADTRACAGHPAVLAYELANEIPPTIARWYGPGRIEEFLERLCDIVKAEDPDALVTYVNFPSTEYLELPFLDFVSFNVYLESQRQLDAYLARLQTLAGDRPLVMAEIGLDSLRNGEGEQARVLRWQIETTVTAGCAGAFVFAWTDEWYKGGREVLDWGFGITRRDRTPKPALAAVGEAFDQFPLRAGPDWPAVSVIVCTHNGAGTLEEALAALAHLDYPDYEVVVVDDGSNDESAKIAERYGARVIRTENKGLSAARNTGLEAALGEVVAFIDDDAWPEPDWLNHLVHALRSNGSGAAGGPNIPPRGDGLIAAAIAHAPGRPTHVLISDREAEHIPGCNLAAWRSSLEEIGGFDPRFRVAGDDVDLCWRLQESGHPIAFSPAAVVWHHPRNSIRAYWKQQRGYGQAEAKVERKWPQKYNRAGHPRWSGRIYGGVATWPVISRRERVFYGTWGQALFQRMYQQPSATVASLPLIPEWYLVLAALLALSAVGLMWTPLLAFVPLLVAAVAAGVTQAWVSARHTTCRERDGSRTQRRALTILTAWLFLIQPLARLRGRLGHGLTPWRRHSRWKLPRKRIAAIWSDCPRALDERLREIESAAIAQGAAVRRASEFDRWDLEVLGGVFGSLRVQTTIEDHSAGRQLFRIRVTPRFHALGVAITLLFVLSAGAAFAFGEPAAGAALAVAGVLLAARMLDESGAATALILPFLRGESTREPASGLPPLRTHS
jgi:GT2 family glycosyltransferase